MKPVLFFLFIIISFFMATKSSSAEPLYHRCSAHDHFPQVGDILQIKTAIQKHDPRSFSDVNRGLMHVLDERYRSCSTKKNTMKCQRGVVLEVTSPKSTSVFIEAETLFRLSRRDSATDTVYIFPRNQIMSSSLTSYLSVTCFVDIISPTNIYRNRQIVPCTIDDMSLLFTNITQQSCDEF